MSSSRVEKANEAMGEAIFLTKNRRFEDAKAMIQEAINLDPTIRYGPEMITLCEIRLLCIRNPQRVRNTQTWPYTLFQIPISSTESQVESRYRKLMDDLDIHDQNYQELLGRAGVRKELTSAMSMYYQNHGRELLVVKHKAAPSPSPTSQQVAPVILLSDGDDDIAVASASTDEDLFAARFPQLKKLRKCIFATLPQQPHFIPLEKYYPSVRQEMRLGFDLIFVKLAQKLQNYVGDQILSDEEEDAVEGELSNLQDMGYDVVKLRERFNLLVRVKALSKEDERYEEIRKNLEGEISAVTAELEKNQHRLSVLEIENEVVKLKQGSFYSEMASLKFKLSQGNLFNMVKMEGEA